MANITPECWALYDGCMDEVRDTVENPCQEWCRRRYKKPSQIEQLETCYRGCRVTTKACQERCKRLLEKCSGRSPEEEQRYTESEKKRFRGGGSTIPNVGGPVAVAGIIMLALTPAAGVAWRPAWFGAGAGTAAIGIGLLLYAGHAIEKADDDPIDNNFKSKARPRPPEPIVVKADPGTPIDADVAEAMNAVLENQAHLIGLDRAMMTSINRAQGAAAAKQQKYEKFQMKNARIYAGESATLLRAGAGLRSKAATRLRGNGVAASMTEDQAAKLQLLLFEAGMPPKLKRVVSRYCEDDTEESEVWFRYTSQLVDVHNLQITFPDLLSDPKLASAEKKIASALDDFSRSTYIRVR